MGNLDGVVERYAALARRATIFKLSEEVAAWLWPRAPHSLSASFSTRRT